MNPFTPTKWIWKEKDKDCILNWLNPSKTAVASSKTVGVWVLGIIISLLFIKEVLGISIVVVFLILRIVVSIASLFISMLFIVSVTNVSFVSLVSFCIFSVILLVEVITSLDSFSMVWVFIEIVESTFIGEEEGIKLLDSFSIDVVWAVNFCVSVMEVVGILTISIVDVVTGFIFWVFSSTWDVSSAFSVKNVVVLIVFSGRIVVSLGTSSFWVINSLSSKLVLSIFITHSSGAKI